MTKVTFALLAIAHDEMRSVIGDSRRSEANVDVIALHRYAGRTNTKQAEDARIKVLFAPVGM